MAREKTKVRKKAKPIDASKKGVVARMGKGHKRIPKGGSVS